MLTGLLKVVREALGRDTDWLMETGTFLTSLLLKSLMLFLLVPPASADTLSPCGWRGTRTLRCYEDTNGDFIRQEDEPYWEKGVEEMEEFQRSQ